MRGVAVPPVLSAVRQHARTLRSGGDRAFGAGLRAPWPRVASVRPRAGQRAPRGVQQAPPVVVVIAREEGVAASGRQGEGPGPFDVLGLDVLQHRSSRPGAPVLRGPGPPGRVRPPGGAGSPEWRPRSRGRVRVRSSPVFRNGRRHALMIGRSSRWRSDQIDVRPGSGCSIGIVVFATRCRTRCLPAALRPLLASGSALSSDIQR